MCAVGWSSLTVSDITVSFLPNHDAVWCVERNNLRTPAHHFCVKQLRVKRHEDGRGVVKVRTYSRSTDAQMKFLRKLINFEK
jgi:hypothetical protein